MRLLFGFLFFLITVTALSGLNVSEPQNHSLKSHHGTESKKSSSNVVQADLEQRSMTESSSLKTGYECPPELSLPKPTKSYGDENNDPRVQLFSGLHKIYNFEEDPELARKLPYSEFIQEINKVRDSLLSFHCTLKYYVCSDQPNFENFVEDYPKINTEFARLAQAVFVISQKKSVLGEKVKNYYNKVNTMFHLLELLCGIRLRGSEVRSSSRISDSHTSEPSPKPQKARLKSLCSNLMDIEIYLAELFEAHRKYRFHPGGFETGVESANKRFETSKDESQDLSSGVPLCKVSDEDLDRIEQTLERLTLVQQPESLSSSNDKDFETPTKETEGALLHSKNLEDLNVKINQRFNIMYLADRLHFVRDCLLEISDSAALGFNIYEAVNSRLHDICDEVKTQLKVLETPSKRSKRLLNNLLQVTIFRLEKMDETAISKDISIINKLARIEEETESSKYQFREVDGVKFELENSLAILKKAKDQNLIMDPDNFNEMLSRNLKRWREMCACLQGRDWYWGPEASIVKLMECEISAILRTMQNFSHEKYTYKKRGNYTKSENSVSESQSVLNEETGDEYIRERSGNFWSKWGCCH